ncbi:hypothetical protein Tco_0775016, partial [Tanacetum coccineum]
NDLDDDEEDISDINDEKQKKRRKNICCFKFVVSDGSATISMTCCSDQANSLTRDCNELLAEITDKDPYRLPSSLKDLEGTTHTFRFHFDTRSTSNGPDFVLEFSRMPHYSYQHQLLRNSPTMANDLSQPAQSTQKLTPTPAIEEEQEQVQKTKPPSPALSTTASNQPDNNTKRK